MQNADHFRLQSWSSLARGVQPVTKGALWRDFHQRTEYLCPEPVVSRYELPLAEVIHDYFDRLKSITSGYGAMDHELIGFRVDDLVKLNILVNGAPADALSVIVHHSLGEYCGRRLIARLKRRLSGIYLRFRFRSRSATASSPARRSSRSARM